MAINAAVEEGRVGAARGRSFSGMSYDEEPPSLTKVWGVLILLIFAYCGKYFCTSCLYVVQDLWKPDQDISEVQASWMFVFGYLASMIGKAVAGPWSDVYGGKIVMAASVGGFLVLITVFAYVPAICEALGVPKVSVFGGEPNYIFEYIVVWFANGFFALGLSWVAIMAIASNWVPESHTGRLMAVLGLAPELGDSWARYYLSPIVKSTGSWAATLVAAAKFSALLCIPMFLFVADYPKGAAPGEKKKKAANTEPFFQRIGRLFKSAPLISLLMTMCGFLYAIRTMFLLYSVNYLSHVLCAQQLAPISLDELQGGHSDRVTQCIQHPDTVAQVATASALYTVFGCIGVFLSGILKDALPKRHRSSILVGNIAILIIALGVMKWVPANVINFWVAAVMVGFVGFSVFGAYKTSTGAFAVDIGGKEFKATCSALMGFSSNGAAAAIIVCKGFLGGDWDKMFGVLVALGFCAIFCAQMIYNDDLKRIGKPAAPIQQPLLNGGSPQVTDSEVDCTPAGHVPGAHWKKQPAQAL